MKASECPHLTYCTFSQYRIYVPDDNAWRPIDSNDPPTFMDVYFCIVELDLID